MISYFSQFPEKYATEIRTAIFPEHENMPAGKILFNEYFCPNKNCNCQQVLIGCEQLLDKKLAPKPYAMISYSWNRNSKSLWRGIDRDLNLGNPFLDPFHINKKFASELMEFWYEMYQNDRNYRERIFRHYRELRDAVCGKFLPEDGTGMSEGIDNSTISISASKLHGNPTLLTNTVEIKKKARARQKALQQKLSPRQQPK